MPRQANPTDNGFEVSNGTDAVPEKDVVEEGRGAIPDGGAEMVQACPDCDSTRINRRNRKDQHSRTIGDEKYRCLDCEYRFDEPNERELEGNVGRNPSTISRALADADPDEDYATIAAVARLPDWGLEELHDLGPRSARKLREAGIETLADIYRADRSDLIDAGLCLSRSVTVKTRVEGLSEGSAETTVDPNHERRMATDGGQR